MTDDQIENEIQAKGLTAPRITPADVEAAIESEYYFTAYAGAKWGRVTRDEPKDSNALKLLTFCVLVLRNGFTVTGESACASPENFDADLGRKIARQHAVAKVWPLLGYALREQLATAGNAAPEELPASPVPTVDGPGLLRSAIAFLGTTLRTDSRDLTDWRSDVAIAVGLLERALDAPQEPPASGEQP